ncbi:MAG: S24/S26 family peptidase [Eubacterium sp.]|nr:S24/S26 family peptidase [Eubacterium sp.]
MEQALNIRQTTKLDELKTAGFIVIPIKGISMNPLLYADKSLVFIRKSEGRPKKNDVVLYVRPNGIMVLHRIIGFDGDICLIRGDNTFFIERVPLSAVKGVMESCWRGKDSSEIKTTDPRYRLYVRFWNFIYPLRFLKRKAKAGIRKIYKS